VATIRVSVINESKLVAAAEVQAAAAALQRQVSEHFAPAWGVDAALSFVAAGTKSLPGNWWLVILDDSDQAGALGYHDLTDEAMPLGKVFVKTAQDAGVKWTVTASHELLELLADPAINLTVCATENNNLVLYAYEICDPCQADEFGYAIDGVAVSEFLFPSWFETFHRSGVVPLDYGGRISVPFTLLPGGYANVLDTGHPAGAWTEKERPGGDDRGRPLCRTPAGSRLAPRAAPARRRGLEAEPVDKPARESARDAGHGRARRSKRRTCDRGGGIGVATTVQDAAAAAERGCGGQVAVTSGDLECRDQTRTRRDQPGTR